MRLYHIAITLIHLMRIKYQLQQDLVDADLKTALAILHNRKTSDAFPIDYFMINEFSNNQSFCYFFEKFKVTGTDKCFCPFSKNQGCAILHENGQNVHSAKFILHAIDEIDIADVMKYLKKIRVQRFQAKLKFIRRLYYSLAIREDFQKIYGKQDITN